MRRSSHVYAPLLAAAAMLPIAARAQGWKPSQPMKVIVPYPPGGLTDVLGRLVGERLQTTFGQPAVIDLLKSEEGILDVWLDTYAAGPRDVSILTELDVDTDAHEHHTD